MIVLRLRDPGGIEGVGRVQMFHRIEDDESTLMTVPDHDQRVTGTLTRVEALQVPVPHLRTPVMKVEEPTVDPGSGAHLLRKWTYLEGREKPSGTLSFTTSSGQQRNINGRRK